jgi:hypothetical protein
MQLVLVLALVVYGFYFSLGGKNPFALPDPSGTQGW